MVLDDKEYASIAPSHMEKEVIKTKRTHQRKMKEIKQNDK